MEELKQTLHRLAGNSTCAECPSDRGAQLAIYSYAARAVVCLTHWSASYAERDLRTLLAEEAKARAQQRLTFINTLFRNREAVLAQACDEIRQELERGDWAKAQREQLVEKWQASFHQRVGTYREEAEAALNRLREEDDGYREPEAIHSVDQLLALSPAEFEGFVASLLLQDGYSVRQIGRSGDGGVDVVALKGTTKVVIQCKRYRGAVGEPVVRDLMGAVVHESATYGCVITTGSFSVSARRWAVAKPLVLIGGDELIRLRSLPQPGAAPE